jgi:hypothetical protein
MYVIITKRKMFEDEELKSVVKYEEGFQGRMGFFLS